MEDIEGGEMTEIETVIEETTRAKTITTEVGKEEEQAIMPRNNSHSKTKWDKIKGVVDKMEEDRDEEGRTSLLQPVEENNPLPRLHHHHHRHLITSSTKEEMGG
jgi:hypothetical protein